MRNIIDTNTIFGIWPKANVDCSIEKLNSVLHSKGITRAFTISARGVFYDFEEGNDETFEVCKKSDNLIPVATVIPQRYFGCREEIIKRIDQGFKVFKFFPEFQEWGAGYLPFLKLLDILADTSTIIILPAFLGISNISRLTAGIKNSVIISELRFSDLAECLQVLHLNTNIYLETQRISSIDALEIFSSEGLINRLVIGSYAPVRYISPSITQIEFAEISQEEKDRIFFKNIEEMLKGVKL